MEFQDPFARIPDELWEVLRVVSRDDPLVHRVMEFHEYRGIPREHAAIALAFALLNENADLKERMREALANQRTVYLVPSAAYEVLHPAPLGRFERNPNPAAPPWERQEFPK